MFEGLLGFPTADVFSVDGEVQLRGAEAGVHGDVCGALAQRGEGDGFSNAPILASVPIDRLPLGGGFALAESEVEGVSSAMIGEVVGKKLEANLRVALRRAQVEIHTDGLGASREIAAEKRAIAAEANRGVIFNCPTALFIDQFSQ